jgi:hypothetical protein
MAGERLSPARPQGERLSAAHLFYDAYVRMNVKRSKETV